ncbi:MAG TPA: Na(+)/H(+) antiporter subunit D [Candidatus Limnocylindria bacterium]|nr:Na(+)/H(+) antiporter subunit D [Candidatus Limnocylindria bacterium]
MTEWLLHPAAPYVAAAAVAAVAPARVRGGLLVMAGAAAVWLAFTLPSGNTAGTLMGQALMPLRMDGLARPFAIVFALVGTLGAVYALDVRRRRFHLAACVACASALTLVLAGDWITFYAAWEILALASFALIADGGTARARGAAYRYLLVHVAGGACLLGGIVWHVGAGGGLLVQAVPAGGSGMLILIAFLVNAAVPPLHAWLTDAYPESSPAGGVLLSAFVTKSAVYALARVFPGVELLLWAGIVMALWGVVLAVIENDIRRLLGYHIVSQVGYMVAGIGLGTPLAISGAVAHAFCHILYKGLLFMATGAVIQATGRRRLTELGGLGRLMPATLVLYMAGALSISGAPLLNGFVSKSIIVAAAQAEHATAMEWLLMLAAVGTFVSVGLKLPLQAFGGGPATAPPAPVPAPMIWAMSLAAALCLLLGVWPSLLYRLLPFAVDYRPYTPGHVFETLEVLLGAALGFVVLGSAVRAKAMVTRDFDRAYRALGRAIALGAGGVLSRGAATLEALAYRLVAGAPAAPRALAQPVGYAVLTALVAIGILLAFLA